jgi:hypothetical protein
MLRSLALALITLHGPEGQAIFVNPQEIVSFREPRDSNADHFAPSIHCVLQTADGKLINVTDTCDEVRHKLGSRP